MSKPNERIILDTTRESSKPRAPSPGPQMVTGLFRDHANAEQAYTAVTQRGYDRSDVNLVMSDATRKKHFASGVLHPAFSSKALEGASIGTALGGTVGAISAAVAAVGMSIVFPGLGLVIAGPVAAALLGAGAGGLTGGLMGALIGWGIPHEKVKDYESGIKKGGIALGVNPRSDEDAAYFEKEWKNNRGQHVYR